MSSARVGVISLGGVTSREVAEVVQRAVDRRAPGTLPVKTVAVLAIRGDERISQPGDHWLRWEEFSAPVGLVVIGDYVDGTGGGDRVAYEAVRLLHARGLDVHAPALLVDTPIHRLPEQCEAWVTALRRGATVLRRGLSTSAQVQPRGGADEEALNRLEAALGAVPLYRFVRGRCEAVRLVTSDVYPRSLLIRLNGARRADVWLSLSQLTSLRDLRVSHAELTTWPSRFLPPRSLRSLDVRGNPFGDWSFLDGIQSLHRLNVAACSLTSLPDEINRLSGLQQLLAYKNELTAVPEEVGWLSDLVRLSLYRNEISEWTIGAHAFPALRTINIGANPLSAWHIGIGAFPQIEEIGLDRSPLGTFPAELSARRSLRRLSIRRSTLTGTVATPNSPGTRVLLSDLDRSGLAWFGSDRGDA